MFCSIALQFQEQHSDVGCQEKSLRLPMARASILERMERLVDEDQITSIAYVIYVRDFFLHTIVSWLYGTMLEPTYKHARVYRDRENSYAS